MTIAEAEPDNSSAPSPRSSRVPLLLAVVATSVGLLIVCLAAFLLLRDANVGPFARNATVTPFAPGVGAPTQVALIVADVSNSPGISLTLNSPTGLLVGGKSFSVIPENVDPTGRWEPRFPNADTAVWVFGTVVNYALGLDDSSDNRRVLESLQAGDEIRLRTQSGTDFVFVVTTREIVSSNQADIFSQQAPSITLVMVGSEGEDRLVVRGDFQTAEGGTGAGSGQSPSGGNVVEMGDTAQLGDFRFTVDSATSLFDRPEAPPGFMFFLVNFQVQNAGSTNLDTASLRYELHDEFGNRYALNSVASQLGTSPPLFGSLNPGEVRAATAGYQLPVGLSSPTLTWVVSQANDQAGQQVRVRIPFAVAGSESGQSLLVVPQSAEVSLDGTSVTVVGQLTNTGEQPLIVNDSDVTLTSDGTLYLKLSTNPSFPWVAPPGQTMTFSVAFQRPLSSEAVFTVLGQPFLLSGLR